MDGRTGDGFIGGRKALPATLEEALSTFPPLIADLHLGILQVSVGSAAGEKRLVTCTTPQRIVHVMLESDFLEIRKIAAFITSSAFPIDNRSILESRARSQVRIVFAGRGVPV